MFAGGAQRPPSGMEEQVKSAPAQKIINNQKAAQKENSKEYVPEAESFKPLMDAQIDFLGYGELKDPYKLLRKEFINKQATVSAL